MAQIDAMRKYVKNSGSGTSEQTIEQLLQCEDHSWGMQNSPTFGKNHDHEEHDHHNTKKSVLMKVKEKAKKLRHTLSNKTKKHNDNATPAWGVSLEDYYDDDDEGADAEYYGAPMYESVQAPEEVKMTAKQHPREDVVIPENHILPNSPSPRKGHESKDKTVGKFSEQVEEKKYEPMGTINKTSQTIAEKPALAPVSIPDSATENIVRQESFSESNAKNLVEEWTSPRSTTVDKLEQQENAATSKTITETVTEKLAPAYAMASEATGMITSKLHGMAIATSAALSPKQSQKSTSNNEKTYDKGVSVKEYLMNKFEPGDDEKALSQVISEAMSPRKESPARRGVVEKVRGAISSHLAATKDSSSQIPKNTSSTIIPISITTHERNTSSTSIPISTNAHEEENEGLHRILQSN